MVLQQPEAVFDPHDDGHFSRHHHQANNNDREDVHKQGRFFTFTNPQTEARYTEYRFGSVGLYFLCAVGCLYGFMFIPTPFARFQADMLRTSPVDWFKNGPWQEDQYVVTRYGHYAVGIFQFLFVGSLLAYKKFIRKTSAPFSGKSMAIFTILICASQSVAHALLDSRQEVYCRENEWSIHLRDDFVVSECVDFVEPYLPISWMSAFLLLPQFRHVVLTMVLFLPTPFYLRYPNGYDYVFRGSDAVWFFNAAFYLVAFAAYEYTSRQQFIQHEIVEEEVEETKRAKSTVSRLLDAMLPASVLKRLIANEEISDSGVVSTVFSDAAGFTAWCSAQKAESVVWMLNVMYTHFDNGLQHFCIEKVKTVGDAYWAICGLPDPDPLHILNICAFAKYMHRCVQRMGEDDKRHILKIRVGVHTGNVCGGLVGSHQSTYDMFGTTNEVAEVMEQRAPVGGILISEPAYLELKKQWPKHEGELAIELQDEAIDTVQGTMSTYVLKTFDWSPLNNTRTSTIPPWTDKERADNHNLLDDDDVCVENATDITTVPADQHPSPTESHPLEKKSQGEQADASPEETLAKQRATLFAASHKLHHTFDNEEVENDFQQFMRTVFPSKLKAVNCMLGGMILVIYVVMLAEGYSHPWYTHLMIVIDLLLIVGAAFIVDRVSVHPLAGLIIFYVECNLLVLALFSANRSLVSMDLVYVIFNFAIFSPTLGYVGGLPYLSVFVGNIIFLLTPTLIIMVLVKTIFVVHVHIPAIFAALWIIALRRSEISQRDQFVNKKLADVALQQTRTQHQKVSELLSRMVPRFIVDELTIWVCGPRDTMIADNFPLVGILFARVPTFHDQFSDSSIDPIAVMGLIGTYANVCDSVLNDFPDCTKLKIIGDVLLFASGLVSDQTISKDEDLSGNPLKRRKNDEASSIDSASLCSSNRSSAYSEPIQRDEKDAWAHHLVPLAHLACALSVQVQDHFDGAKISAGMHCGNATGGVIGNDRLIYDVFGDTVNTASRVMSTSGEGVWASVKFSTKLSGMGKHGLFLGRRVERQMKGKGTMHVVSVAALPK